MQYVGFIRRTLATVIDILIISLVVFVSVALASKIKGYSFEATKGYVGYGIDNAIILLGYIEGFFVALFSGTSTLSHFWSEVTTVVPNDSLPTLKLLIYQLILVLLGFNIYHIICEWTVMQGSIGKFICRTKIISLDGHKPGFFKIILRNLLKLASTLLLGIGHIWILFSKRKQAAHDYLSGTFVVVKGRLKDDEQYPRWY